MAANAAWVKHPGFYIKEEMDARGWLQRDLAFILGVPEQAVNMILSGKRGISAEMAQALALAFDVEPEFFANLQQRYDLAHATNPYPGVHERGRMQSVFPVREMIQRGWILKSDATMLESQLDRFFEKTESGQIPYLAHAARKSRYEEREIPPVQLAWLFRVRQIAKSIRSAAYSERKLKAAIGELDKLLLAPEEARHVSRILSECGVRIVFVEKLPGANIDGVCFWIGPTPVIGMSLKRDTIDNFWFVLRHEIEHVLNRDGRDDEVIDVLEGENASTTNPAIPRQERVANAAAADFCAPSQKLDLFMARKHPFYSERDVLAFARQNNRHPGLVVGQMQKRLDRWDYLTRHLAKIRQFALSGGIVDGWGQQAPVSL